MKEFPQQPGARAVVLNRDETTDDPHNYKTVYVRLKILTEPGRSLADVEIPYSRRSFHVYDVTGRTVHSDGTVIPFTGKPFDKVIVRKKERGTEERYQVKTFTLPDVQVGSIVEYRYHLSYDDHSFYPPEWEVQTELFQKKASFKFIPYPGLLQLAHDRIGNGVAWTSFLPKGSKPVEHDLMRSSMASNRTATGYVDLQITDLPPVVHEPFMPPTEAIRYRVNFYYMVGAKQEEFWKDEGKFWNKDVESFLGRKNGVSEKVSGLVAAADTPEQKARKIYAFITTLDNWSYQPAREAQEDKALGIKAERGAEDVLRQHGGWHDDLNKLYAAMLRAAGIPAYMMWVPSRDEEFFDPALLSTRQLVAEIVITQLNGKEMFLDPGTKFCAFGLLNWRYSNVRGLRQREGKGTEIAESDLPTYNQAQIQRLARVRMTPEGKAEGTIKVGFYGMEAMEWRQVGGKTDAEGRKKLLEDGLKRWLPADSEVKLVNAPDWDATEEHLAAAFEVSCPLAVSAGKRWIIPVHLFQVNEKPRFSGIESDYVVIDTRRGVVHPDVPSPAFDHMILGIELPSETKADQYRSVVTTKSGKRYLIFDPTDPYTPLGDLRGELQDSYALLVADGKGELIHTPLFAPDANLFVRTGHFTLSPEGALAGDIVEDRTGDHAWRTRAEFIHSNAQERAQQIERRLSRSLQGFTLEKTDIEGLDQNQQKLVISLKLNQPGYGQVRGPLMLVRPRVLGEKGFALEKKPRHYPFQFDEASRETDTFEIELPKEYVVDDVPDPVKVDAGFASYESKIVVEGSKLRYWREFVRRDVLVGPERTEDLRKFLATIGGDEAAVVVLKRAQ